VALLPLNELRQQPQRGLVGDRVEVLQMDSEGVDQRRLRSSIGQFEVAGRVRRLIEVVE
jgi:hypothetical protein